MKTIAIVNQKGGSGKTTTAVNLAAALGAAGRKVLLADLDPQASATDWCGVINDDNGGKNNNASKGIYDVFVRNASITTIICKPAINNISLAPASPWMVGIEKALAAEVGAETILREQLEQINSKWDYVLLDCPPTLGILTVNALTASDYLLVPVEAHIMALNGLAQLLRTVELVQQRLNPYLALGGILACRVDGRTRHAQEIVEELRNRFGSLVYQTVIRENVRLAECPSFRQAITEYAPDSAGAQDYRSLAQELIKQEKNHAQKKNHRK